ncbi:hypothetical protein HJ526_18530 [Donghicola sp. C2-DW-16]|uniref:DUF2842 domain-containing protein n=1 Tax=Donghicola mangrovi TaxID=2729614 RepID=A0ABX2PK99_9RHOB|nr:hypothetical protein [Donghicola mangrovi]NVO29422.1 hypothetical protein [Donghicola mangrovi]
MDTDALFDSLFTALPLWGVAYLLFAMICGIVMLFKNDPMPVTERDLDSPIVVVISMLAGLLWPFMLMKWIGDLFSRPEPAPAPTKPKRAPRPKRQKRR